MYVPSAFAPDPESVQELLLSQGAADLVTATPDGLMASTLPFLYDPDAGEHGVLLAHLARPNEQWRAPVLGEAMVIVRGPDGYVTPNWYPSKAEHGRAVPTWNYLSAHVYGALVVHDDPEWLRPLVRRLTERHENAPEAGGWSVDDAPAEYVTGMLRAIVGVELVISRIEAKFKLSQNRPPADIDGVVAGLTGVGDTELADQVSRHRPAHKN